MSKELTEPTIPANRSGSGAGAGPVASGAGGGKQTISNQPQASLSKPQNDAQKLQNVLLNLNKLLSSYDEEINQTRGDGGGSGCASNSVKSADKHSDQSSSSSASTSGGGKGTDKKATLPSKAGADKANKKPYSHQLLPIFDPTNADAQALTRFWPLFRNWLEIRYGIRQTQQEIRSFKRDHFARLRKGLLDPSEEAKVKPAGNSMSQFLVETQINKLNIMLNDCDKCNAEMNDFKSKVSCTPSSNMGFFLSWSIKQVSNAKQKILHILGNKALKATSTSDDDSSRPGYSTIAGSPKPSPSSASARSSKPGPSTPGASGTTSKASSSKNGSGSSASSSGQEKSTIASTPTGSSSGGGSKKSKK